ncbi:MAG: leucine-rich repeat domain-containing protein [Alphaproteobacteria bacterium]|nr:leucine-rich repeat domain-containing protein [Alphaproteobacteria bacterium]
MKKYALILGLLMPMVAYADCDSNGKCVWDCSPDDKTNTCTATFENGTLSISGTEMKNDFGHYIDTDTYNITSAPWNDEAGHLKQITNVVIGSEMKNIGGSFLMGATNLEHITIPENIESMGNNAFYHTGLKSVDWPASLKTIRAGTFQYTHLTDFSFLDGIETIGDASFNGVFWYADSPIIFVVPDSVKTIGQNAFTGNNMYLQNIILGENVTSIDTEAFDSSLQTIYCTGDIDVCKTNVGEAFADKVKQATAKKINGVTYVYDKNGNLITTSGHRKERRIYTIEEANAVAGDKNRVSIKYR